MTLIPAPIDFTVYQGARFDETITFYQDAAATQPEDFAGATAVAMIRKDFDSPALLTFKTSPGGGEGTITLGAGTVRLQAVHGLTEGLAASMLQRVVEEGEVSYRGRWDLEVTNGANRDRYAQGVITLSLEVTK